MDIAFGQNVVGKQHQVQPRFCPPMGLHLTQIRPIFSVISVDPRAAYYCGGRCTLRRAFLSRTLFCPAYSHFILCVAHKYLLRAHAAFSNSPGPPLHILSEGEGQATSWDQALYANNMCVSSSAADKFVTCIG
jgi:hypothetical protein